MNPLTLELMNFRAIPYANIDLEDVTIAAICGRNGAGKSSGFTMAPRFALFGDVIEGVSMDDLVRRGTQEMAVTFTFEHQGSIYRVIRTRSLKGNGKSTLEFQQRVRDRWESKSAEKIKDTEAVIRNLLNLDDETFTASSMIMQSKANEFTAKSAGKRKETLQQILGLNVYDRLQDAARQRAAGLNLEIEKAKDKLADFDERLKQKLPKTELLESLNQEAEAMKAFILAKENELRQQEEKIRELQTKAEKAAELSMQLNSISKEIAPIDTEKEGLVAKLGRAEKILAKESEILANTAEFYRIKEQITMLEARQSEQERLISELESIEVSAAKIKNETAPFDHRIRNLQQLLQSRELFIAKADEYTAATLQLKQLEMLAEQWDSSEKEIMDVRARYNEEQVRVNTLKSLLESEIHMLESKISMLADSNCIDVSKASCLFLSDAKEAKQVLTRKYEELNSIDLSKLTTLNESMTRLTEKQQAIGYDFAAHRALRVRIEELRPIAEEASQMQAKEELLNSLQEQYNRLTGQMDELTQKQTNVQQELNSLHEALAPLPVLRRSLDNLQAWANLKDQISAAHEAKKSSASRITAIDMELQSKTSRIRAIEEERALLLLDAQSLDSAVTGLPTIQRELQYLRDRQHSLAEQIGGLKTELSALSKDEQDRQQFADELEPKARKWSRYQTLIRAFGRDGIPALIIENAVPKLEHIANEILGKMSKGKHYIRFETQRELKSREGVQETLDIMIGDWTSERPYETFSGGEQLRIDYAIRFALAELLAQRAGSKVEWLTIDEGLGSQDAEHRGLVLESIKAVAERFKKVLVITHIEEAQAVFEQQIFFENTEAGVDVKVA
ncbi:SMC family ATPase [Bacillus sp. 3255]|uniref:SMC family ATPase n=1 Tax=Bacillus sp. 3255 TaxID=2817904 RepID=UPI002867934C|nr:SMC family ATPase [Bacillus sp. 3255]MDR6880397.1 exonuclease SbcC [Bacillus sp. 3255]